MPYWFDGNNLTGQSAEAAEADREPRRAFLQLLSGFARTGGGSFLVFFDGDENSRSMPPRGIRVRFSAPESADGLILRKLSESSNPREVIVVTNDRKLASSCRDGGSQTMTWSEFTRKRRRPTGGRGRNPDERVNIREWAEFFGLDPTDLK
jgi:hypothetical protein